MPTDKQDVKVHIRLNYGDTISDIIERIPSGVSYDDVYLEYDYDDRDIGLSYKRLETDKEFEDRISLEKRRKELDKNRDMNQLKYLLSVYGIPNEYRP